ncbi:Non-specific ribonucleoside hydrolase rihC [Serratia fonticola]|uniref:Non-specific ribonucleoside hydrolase rihC n=1 Tax=Serratia fonticola TaxID=47917 RepID=A0A4U9THD3_SERFO|nr:Non-specific ribonucleoside hydrolase rihC [Serratia fonticola]
MSSSSAPIAMILDTDPGIDDAVALVAALFHPKIDLRLVSTVAGNVSVDKTTHNALRLLHFLGASTPVARGQRLHWYVNWKMPAIFTATLAWMGTRLRSQHGRSLTVMPSK